MAITDKQWAALKGWREQLGRWEAARLGLHMNKGGWLRTTVNNRVVAQGYWALYHKHYRQIWQALERAQ